MHIIIIGQVFDIIIAYNYKLQSSCSYSGMISSLVFKSKEHNVSIYGKMVIA